MKVWNYTLKSEGVGEGWALVMMREDGFFATISDYGNYAYLWSSIGTDDFRKFILSLDGAYLARKLKPESHVDADESFKNVAEDLKSRVKDGSLSKDQAKKARQVLARHSSDGDWEGFLRDQDAHQYFEEPWGFAISTLDSDVLSYAEKVLPRLKVVIQKDLEADQALPG